MKHCNGAWLPDDETDAVMLSAGINYQSNKLQAALRLVKNSRLAVDVGAHCGLWSLQLGRYFERVECFEPLPRHIECWQKNIGWKKSCYLHDLALGEDEGHVGINVVEGKSGQSHIMGDGEIVTARLDDYNFKNVDLIKIDVEGYEYFVCRGAEKTLLDSKPVVIVEQKPGMAQKYGLSETQAVDYLESLGMVFQVELMGDYILDWGRDGLEN